MKWKQDEAVTFKFQLLSVSVQYDKISFEELPNFVENLVLLHWVVS